MKQWLRRTPLPLAVVGIIVFGIGQYLKWPNWLVTGAFIFSALMLVISLLIEIEFVSLMQRRGARYGATLALALAFILVIIVATNVIAYRHYARWDLTATGMFSLSDQTVKILRRLPAEVRVIGFFTPNDVMQERRFDDLMQEYGAISPRLKVEKYDPTRYPLLARQYKLTSIPSIVVVMKGEDNKERFEKAQQVTESAITGALIRLLYPEKPTVCYLTGHGEYALSGFDQMSLRGWKRLAEQENYTFKEIPFFTKDAAKECRVVMIVRPQYEPQPKETEMLTQFIHAGGRVWVNLEPNAPEPWAKWLQSFGVEVGRDAVLDLAQTMQGVDPSVVPVTPRPGSPLVGGSTTLFAVFATAQSVQASGSPGEEITTDEVVQSINRFPYVFADRNMNHEFDQGTDVQGPVKVGVLVRYSREEQEKKDERAARPPKGQKTPEAADNTRKQSGAEQKPPPSGKSAGQAKQATASVEEETLFRTEGRLVVFGDADWLTDGVMAISSGNAVLALNTLAWLAERELLISEKKPSQVTLRFERFHLQAGWIRFLTMILLPAMLIITGVAVWFVRRRL